MRDKRFVDAARLEPAKIRDGVLRAREDDEGGPGEIAGASGVDHAHTLLGRERREVGEVGDVRQLDDGHGGDR